MWPRKAGTRVPPPTTSHSPSPFAYPICKDRLGTTGCHLSLAPLFGHALPWGGALSPPHIRQPQATGGHPSSYTGTTPEPLVRRGATGPTGDTVPPLRHRRALSHRLPGVPTPPSSPQDQHSKYKQPARRPPRSRPCQPPSTLIGPLTGPVSPHHPLPLPAAPCPGAPTTGRALCLRVYYGSAAVPHSHRTLSRRRPAPPAFGSLCGSRAPLSRRPGAPYSECQSTLPPRSPSGSAILANSPLAPRQREMAAWHPTIDGRHLWDTPPL